MMIGLFDALKIGAGAALGAALISAPAYHLGKRDGRQEAANAAIQSSITVLRSRSATDEEINRSDLAGLCRYFGLLEDDERECLRRMEAAAADTRNSSENHDGR